MANAKKDQNRIPTLTGVSSTDGVTPINVYVDPITHRLYVDLAGGGGGLTEIPFTGTVNGTNVAFTVASSPTYVVTDGVWLKALDNNGGTQWSYSAGTVTMIVPPLSSIYGF